MALLNPPEIVPSVMRVIFDYLAHAASAVTRKDLENTICPPNVTPAGRPVFKASLLAATELGLVHQEEDRLSVKAPTGADFRQVLRQRVFDPSNNDPSAVSDRGASDLTRALAWFLAQDAYAGVEPWISDGPRGVQKLQKEQFAESRAFQNDTRWNSFNRWGPALGLATHVPWKKSVTVLPDPTVAISEELPAVFANDRRIALDVFLDRLSSKIPVLDGGRYRASVETLASLPAGEGLVSHSISHVLWRLAARGTVELHSLADAPQFMLQGSGSSKTPYSHVELNRKAVRRGEP